MMRYGITTHSGTFQVWSGPFYEVWEGEGILRDGASRTTITTYNGDKVRVKFPEGVTLPRNESNYPIIDAAISDALTKHHADRGDIQIKGD